MSSLYVRNQLKQFLSTYAPSEKVVDLTAEFSELSDLLETYEISLNDTWTGVQFIGHDEVPITVGSNNSHGKYRETGAIYIHVVDIASLGVSDRILARAESLRDLLRGRKLGTMFLESMTPVNFESGAALRFEDGYMCGSFMLSYQNDKDF